MFEVAVLTTREDFLKRCRPAKLSYSFPGDRNKFHADLYPDQPFSVSFDNMAKLDAELAKVRHRPDTHTWILCRPFDTLAQALAFKLQVEGPEFEVTIVEMINVS
ncbi:hypothetical protein [uncultured Brevundimonas sp.]|uniref:hypothetical protein n=1 Tax=uncultured Brevundimonas sp. TaxID=213418 RepID=UPI0025EB8A91|nr:hypothetical protein [uncultured Brevundimonas sp.]